MGSNAPTWADQWSDGGEGDRDKFTTSKDRLGSSSSGGGGNKKKMAEVKAAAGAGLDKAKTAAVVGGQKLKNGTSLGIKWVKDQYQKKRSSK